MPKRVRLTQRTLDVKLWAWAWKWARKVKQQARRNANNQILRRRTGRFYRSIKTEVEVVKTESAVGFAGTGFTLTAIDYGIAQDVGFTRKAFTVRPREKKALKFRTKQGDEVFAAKVRIPRTTFEETRVLSSAVEDNLSAMSTDLAKITRQNIVADLSSEGLSYKNGAIILDLNL